jgi:hypothetical protein
MWPVKVAFIKFDHIVDNGGCIPAVSFIGKTFHNIKIIAFLGRDKRGNNYWWALCKCGTLFSLAGRHCKNEGQQSCGCVKKEFARNLWLGKRKEETPQYKPQGINQVKGVFGSYLKSASRRGLAFELTLEQFSTLTKEPCYYCGEIDVNSKTGKYGKYRYNGVDRKNNLLGYTIENSVPCCKNCNIAKGINTQDFFIAMCKKIVENHKD